ALRALHAVIRAVGEGAAALVGAPQLADEVDRLLERGHRLAGRQPSAAHRRDRVPESAGAEAQLEAAAAEEVEARGRARDDGWRAQWHVEHIRGDADAVGARRDV